MTDPAPAGNLPIDSFRESILQSVERNPIVILTAETGAGKSTLLRAVMGAQPTFAGRILFEGADLTRASASALRDWLESLRAQLISGGTETMFEVCNPWQRAWAEYQFGSSAIDYVRPSGSGGESLLRKGGLLAGGTAAEGELTAVELDAMLDTLEVGLTGTAALERRPVRVGDVVTVGTTAGMGGDVDHSSSSGGTAAASRRRNRARR